MRLGLYAPSAHASYARGLRLTNVSIRAPLRYLRVSRNRSHTGRRGDNFVRARAPNVIEVVFARVLINGKLVRSDEAWNMRALGKVSVVYDEA